MTLYKKILAAIIFMSCSIAASAQKYGYAEDRFRDNWFVSGGVGVNALSVNICNFDSPAGFALDFNAGKWFSPMFGARAGWQGLNFGAKDSRFGYNFIHGDILWDFINTVDRWNDNRIWTLAPYATMGIVLNSKNGRLFSKGFGAGVGLFNSFRVAPRLDLYLDLRAVVQSERAIGAMHGKIAMFSALAGVQYRIGRVGWDKVNGRPDPERLVNNGFWKDWFISASAGANAVTSTGKWDGKYTFTGEIGLGKWFSPYAGSRIAVQGIKFNAPDNGGKYGFAYVHADLLWNFSNTVCINKGTHVWTAAPYAHFGVFNTFENLGKRSKSEFAAGAGLYNAFAASSHIDIIADFRVTAVNGLAAGMDRGIILQPSFSAGLAYNFNARELLRSRRIVKEILVDRSERERSDDQTENNKFKGNWSIFLGGGVNLLSLNIRNPQGIKCRPTFDIGIVKMFSPGFGGRLGVQANSIAYNDKKHDWEFLHGDVLWDIKCSVKGYDPERIWSIAPYLSMGVSFVHHNRVNTRLAGGAGLLNTWKVSDKLGIFLDIRGIMMTESQFTNHGGFGIEASATAGLSVEFGKNYWNKNGNGTRLGKLWENWFVQSMGGFSLVMDTWDRFNGRPGTSMELAIGKWFSPDWGTRLGVQYANMVKDNGSEYDLGYIHGDIIWNLSNTIGGYKPKRIYTISPYLHFGVMGSWEHFGKRRTKDFATGAGLLNNFRIDDKMSFVLDLRARAMLGKNTGKEYGKAIGGEVLAGISYNIGEGSWAPHRDKDEIRGPLAISTNLVSWIDLATVNMSLEYAFSRHWSTDINMEYNAWSFKGGSLCDKKKSVTFGVRYWPWHSYSGAWVRPFLGAESLNAKGLPVKFLNSTSDRFGAGFSAGYSLMVSRHMNIDFGVGFWGGARHDYRGGWGGFIAPKDIRISLMFVL